MLKRYQLNCVVKNSLILLISIFYQLLPDISWRMIWGVAFSGRCHSAVGMSYLLISFVGVSNHFSLLTQLGTHNFLHLSTSNAPKFLMKSQYSRTRGICHGNFSHKLIKSLLRTNLESANVKLNGQKQKNYPKILEFFGSQNIHIHQFEFRSKQNSE